MNPISSSHKPVSIIIVIRIYNESHTYEALEQLILLKAIIHVQVDKYHRQIGKKCK
jgi:hypothetical protein